MTEVGTNWLLPVFDLKVFKILNMKIIVLILFLLSGIIGDASCQMWGDSSVKHRPLFYSVETAPKFKGGLEGYYRFIAENLKAPDNKFAAFSNKIVTARIVIDTAGNIVFAEIEKGINKDYDNAVLEMLKIMPGWSPALQNGQPVPTSIRIPVLFVD